MKKIEPNYIEKLIDIMSNNELTEIVLDDGENTLVVKTNGYKPVVKEEIVEEIVEEIPEEIIEEEPKKNLVPIVSQMIGIFYAKPLPTEEPFVKVGDEIKQEDLMIVYKKSNDVDSLIYRRIYEGKIIKRSKLLEHLLF